MREHNRIATQLASINPSWSDESLFQEARKIVIAIMQHIVYKEWLPVLIGQNYASAGNLLPISGDGFFKDYNPSVICAFNKHIFDFYDICENRNFVRINRNP